MHRYRSRSSNHHLLLRRCLLLTRNRNLSSSSAATDNCPHRGFAKRNPAAAAQVLKIPPYKDLIANNSFYKFFGSRDESLERYITWRGWNIDSILREHSLDDSDKMLFDASIGLLSHPLTFQLTLARNWQTLCSSSSSSCSNVRLCCVGARAECTLPDEYWRELLIATLATDVECNDMRQFTIDFIGPDVPPELNSKTITLGNGVDLSKSELMMNFHSSFLHEVVLKLLKSQQIGTDQIRNLWDAYVLFNPGLGHPHLTKQWKPTLKFLIRTGKPILFTAHSSIDAERDRLVLEQLLLADHNNYNQTVEYQSNPYASRMEFVEPFSKEYVHIVSPNHSFFLLK